MNRLRWCVCVVFLLAGLMPATALAQSGTVSGVVVDQLGARLPGVTVTLTAATALETWRQAATACALS